MLLLHVHSLLARQVLWNSSLLVWLLLWNNKPPGKAVAVEQQPPGHSKCWGRSLCFPQPSLAQGNVPAHILWRLYYFSNSKYNMLGGRGGGVKAEAFYCWAELSGRLPNITQARQTPTFHMSFIVRYLKVCGWVKVCGKVYVWGCEWEVVYVKVCVWGCEGVDGEV